MFDVEIAVGPGTDGLLRVAETLGRAGVGLEGGGMWGQVAHYLVDDGDTARAVLAAAGWEDVRVRPAILADLDADVPGALGRLLTRIADAGVPLVAQYSDHGNRKVLVADDADALRRSLAAGAVDAPGQPPVS